MRHRIFTLFNRLILVCLPLTAQASDALQWPGYPDTLPVYEYPGAQLSQQWSDLTALIHIPYPDADWIRQMLDTYPGLQGAMTTAATQSDAASSLKTATQGDYQPLSEQLQQVWRLHYSGQYEQAWTLGNRLGPLGEIAANYARLINASFILTAPDTRLAEFRACAESSQASLQLAPDYALAEYGLVYARVRMLEMMDNAQARSSGYIGFAQQSLASLAKSYPQEPVYKVTQGGLEAGIVARIGSFLGSLTYGVSEDSAISAFNTALQSPKARRPVVLHEFATAMQRMNSNRYRDSIQQLLTLCTQADADSAEEALVQQQCVSELKERFPG